MRPARTLLISPLVALGRQQQARLEARGFQVWLGMGPEGRTNSSRKQSEYWIVSPEKLEESPSTVHALKDWRPDWMVVDECHCLWEWGREFRPAYRKVPALIAQLGLRRSLWLTATLPYVARRELRAEIPTPLREIGEFAFPESLIIHAWRVNHVDRAQALLDTVAARPGRGIVFVQTREDTHRLARLLGSFRPLPYHAGLGSEEKRAIELRLNQGECRVLIATSAFGLGMDIRELDWVVLWEPPRSLLALAQALGRVGRAGRPGEAFVFWEPADAARGGPSVMNWLHDLRCRRVSIAPYFAGPDASPAVTACGRCDRCRSARY